MAKERLVESFSITKKDLKPIKLTETTSKILVEGKEFNSTEAYKFPMWQLDKENLNGRTYSKELGLKIVKENKKSFGLLDHPSENSEQPDGSVKDIWCIEKDPIIEGNILWFSVYLVGQYGKGLVKDILDAGGGIPLSSSGYGEVNRDGTVDVDSYELERYSDFVLNPSYKVYGFAEYTNNSPVRESVDISKLSIGSKIKFEDTYWKIEKIDGPDHIEVRKANEDSIYKTISTKEIQEIMNEKKIREKTIKDLNVGDKVHGSNGYSIVKKDSNSPGNKYYGYQGETLPDDWDEKELIEVGTDDDTDYVNESINKEKKQEGSMNKKFSVEEKTFRLNVKNLIKEAELKTDLDEKLASYSEILEWFNEGFSAPDLQEEVSKKIKEVEGRIKEFAKKGVKTDSLEEDKKKLSKALLETYEFNKKLTQKYEIATELLDNLKTFSLRMKESYLNQKARANGMIKADKYSEALKAIDTLKNSLKESKGLIKTLKEKNDFLNKKLKLVEQQELEEKKMDALSDLQKSVQKLFKEEEEEKQKEIDKVEQDKKDKEEAEKKAEESIDFGASLRKDIQEYYNDLEKFNKGYKQFKENILGCKTLLEAQTLVLKIKDMVEESYYKTDTQIFKERVEKMENNILPEVRSITSIKRKDYY